MHRNAERAQETNEVEFEPHLGVGSSPPHFDLGVVVHTVRVGQDAAAGDDEPAAGAAELPLPLPRQAVIGLAVHAEHLGSRGCSEGMG